MILNTFSPEALLLMLWLVMGFCGGLIIILHDLFRGFNVSMREGGFIILFLICPMLGPVVLYQIFLDIIISFKKTSNEENINGR